MSFDSQEVMKSINTKRIKRSMTVRDLCKIAKISMPTYYNYSSGRVKYISSDVIKAMLEAVEPQSNEIPHEKCLTSGDYFEVPDVMVV